MIKTPTGRKFTPQEFRLLNPCTQCGRVQEIREGEMCYLCSLEPIPKCSICEICLRFGKYTFYTYDNRDEHRVDVNFNPIKELVREFSYVNEYVNPPVGDTCVDCVDWEYQMRNRCLKCGTKFQNNKEHYKEFGNLCEPCATPEIVDDRKYGEGDSGTVV